MSIDIRRGTMPCQCAYLSNSQYKDARRQRERRERERTGARRRGERTPETRENAENAREREYVVEENARQKQEKTQRTRENGSTSSRRTHARNNVKDSHWSVTLGSWDSATHNAAAFPADVRAHPCVRVWLLGVRAPPGYGTEGGRGRKAEYTYSNGT